MNHRTLTTILLASLLFCLQPVMAQGIDPIIFLAAQDNVPWQNLSPGEQETLKRHSNSWDSYAPSHQKRLQKGSRRYMQLSPEEKRRVKKMRREYMNKSPEERRRLRETYRKQHRVNE